MAFARTIRSSRLKGREDEAKSEAEKKRAIRFIRMKEKDLLILVVVDSW